MGLLISLVAFFFVILWPLYCFFTVRPEYRRRSGSKMKRSVNWQKEVLALIVELGLIGIMVGSFWLGNGGNRAFAESMQSKENLKEISTMLLQYSEDSDGHLPPASRWQDVISQPPYLIGKHAANVFTCPSDNVPCGYAINAAVAGKKVEDIQDPHHTVLVFETRSPGRNTSGSRRDLAPDRYRAIGLPLAFCDGHVTQLNYLNLRNVFWSPHQTRPEEKHPYAPPPLITASSKYRNVKIREVDPYLRNDLLTVGGLFLGSYLLLLPFWLWRWNRWKPNDWSRWLGAGWLLFLAGFAGTLLGQPEAPFWLWSLCLFCYPVCLLVAVWRYGSRYWASLSSDRVDDTPALPSLRRTWQTDPAGKRFILTRSAVTGGVMLLICAAVTLVYTRRMSADVQPFLTVVTLVQNGSLRADPQGAILLPPTLAATSADGHVYLATAENERGEDQPVLYFPITRSVNSDDGPDRSGELQNWTTGYVYAAKPLAGNYGIFLSAPNFVPVGGLHASWNRPGWYEAAGQD